jgi:hypothetical protein
VGYIVRISHAQDPLCRAVAVHNLTLGQEQQLVDVMGTVVAEHTAAEFPEGLPIIAAGIVLIGGTQQERLSQFVGGKNCFGCQYAAILPK